MRLSRGGSGLALKETLAHLWRYSSETWARQFFKGWYGRVRHSALEPVKKVALMAKTRLS
ncbi:MAG: transposase [Planctomycetota bacterium]|nr:transposase [Planctomycetota bacterium]